MYKVLLVDDELWSLVGLEYYFDQEEEFEIIAKIGDPLLAVDIILKKKPDIVVTDIRMADMTGLELIKKIRDEGIDSEFIIVSGYDEFSYAKEAIKQGVIDYILKPIDPDEMGLLISKMQKKLYKKKNMKDMILIEALVEGDDPVKVFNLDKLDLKWNYYQAIIQINGRPYSIVKKLKENCEIVCQLSLGSQKELYILNTPRNIKDYFFINSQNYGSIGISHLTQNKKMILKIVEQAEIAALTKFLPYVSNIYYYKGANIPVVKDIYNSITKSLEYNEEKKCLIIINDLYNIFLNEKLNMEDVVIIWNQIISYIQDCYYNIITPKFGFMNYIQITETFTDLKSMISYIRELIIYIFNDKKVENTNTDFKKILKYIDDHYNENIYLNQLAEQYYMNVSYCCRLFKNEVGKTFTEYLTDIRMEKARYLLVNTQMTIKEIGLQVGYNDYYYFNKVFKKNNKITPFKYRKNRCG